MKATYLDKFIGRYYTVQVIQIYPAKLRPSIMGTGYYLKISNNVSGIKYTSKIFEYYLDCVSAGVLLINEAITMADIRVKIEGDSHNKNSDEDGDG